MNKFNINFLLKNNKNYLNHKVIIKGWVRYFRNNKFLIINDGSTINNIQIFINNNKFTKEFLKKINIGTSIKVTGYIVASIGKNQEIEIIAESIQIYSEYLHEKLQKTILQPKQHSLEKLREQSHLRFRTKIFSAIMRIRHKVSFAIHKYFNENEFIYINTPIITSIDAEGAGSMFRVITNNYNYNLNTNFDQEYIKNNYNFFGKPTYLTVSGQLEAESAALGLNKVYSFGPIFRAEKSNTYKHLSEFWMVEPEISFFTLNDIIDLSQKFLKFLIHYIMNNCIDDLYYLHNFSKKNTNKNLLNNINLVLEKPFNQISYTEAINILLSCKLNKDNRFIHPVSWGIDLKSEHENFLVNQYFNSPVIIFNYPENIKAFYMRLNDDKKTVSSMDILFPNIGEILGGSQREERYNILLKRMNQFKINTKKLWWYLELRTLGSTPHSGFGLGFDRFIQFITGMNNIRDVIPFPRTYNYVEF